MIVASAASTIAQTHNLWRPEHESDSGDHNKRPGCRGVPVKSSPSHPPRSARTRGGSSATGEFGGAALPGAAGRPTTCSAFKWPRGTPYGAHRQRYPVPAHGCLTGGIQQSSSRLKCGCSIAGRDRCAPHHNAAFGADKPAQPVIRHGTQCCRRRLAPGEATPASRQHEIPHLQPRALQQRR
ncbi:hypothetical protein KCP69_05645 [Salmonella enterica subsp. enterica]|nr:hypothetical protein KCP69_05645 [Salmonella enterica subsp. enterica]